ncbi:hypothetical protein, partial [Enterobacter sp. RIT418]|uniref:hypothetical protein n=1 Tax=Enterobacter sp. RIT418 TaxID=2202164 RepID=UPI000D4588A6
KNYLITKSILKKRVILMKPSIIAGVIAIVLSSNVDAVEYIDNAGTGDNASTVIGEEDNASTITASNNAGAIESDNASTGYNETSTEGKGIDDNASTGYNETSTEGKGVWVITLLQVKVIMLL